jgi:hypothetical protein
LPTQRGVRGEQADVAPRRSGGASKPQLLQRHPHERGSEKKMDRLVAIDWAELIVPTHSIGEMLVRGTLTYLSLFLIFRFVMKRQTSTIGIADILVVVVIADAAQNAFSREYSLSQKGLS